VRSFEFPRQHIIVLALVLLVVSWIILDNWLQYSILNTLQLGIILYQVSWVYPYCKYLKPSVPSIESDKNNDIKCMASNVQMNNTQYKDVSTLITRELPDVLFLMETDQRWFDELQSVLKTYTSVTTELKDNCYGCIFATNLKVVDINIHYIAGDDTPSVHATLEDKSGQTFIFRGIHPRPPVPGNTSRKRDEELRQTAKFAREKKIPEIVMGDFNDVVWSASSRKFMNIGQYKDPQAGRGSIKSFHARFSLLRFPIDQLYVSSGVSLVEMYRGPNVGSDHFPILAKLQLR